MDLICQNCGREVVLHSSLLKCEDKPDFLKNSLELDQDSPQQSPTPPPQHDQQQPQPPQQHAQSQPQLQTQQSQSQSQSQQQPQQQHRSRTDKTKQNVKLRVGTKIDDDFGRSTTPPTTPPTTTPSPREGGGRERGREREMEMRDREFRLDKKSKSYSGSQIRKIASQQQSNSAQKSSQQQSYNHHQLITAKKILEMASELTDVDFPVCGDCLDGLLTEYKSLARQEMKESEAHRTFLERFEREVGV